MARKRIGELLLEQGAITREQLEAGLAAHKMSRERLGATLVRLGAITDDQLAAVLADALGIARVDLKTVAPDWEALQLVRPRFCEQNVLIPYAIEHKAHGRKVLMVAMGDPLNAPAIQELEFTTGMAVQVRLASLSAVRLAIMRHYHRADAHTRRNSGEIEILHSGGITRRIDRDGDEIIVGEVVTDAEPDTDLEAFIVKRQTERKQKKAEKAARSATGPDVFFGRQNETDHEQLEQRFWALVRILARKGLITREEFSSELDEAEG